MATTKWYPPIPAPARAILKSRGVSGYRLSKEHGLTQSQVTSTLAGRLTPAKRIADAVMAETGLPPEDLFDLELLLKTRWYGGFLSERLRTTGGVNPQGGGRDE